MKRSAEWRDFEKLVARIEEAAAPRQAVVTVDDKIPDLVTGTLRQVDASIRYKVGTADVLIVIECRKRSRKPDVTWIEQLATKRSAIGAAKTIAVSQTGFSKEAQLMAARHCIELRTLTKIAPSDIQEWFVPSGGAVHVFRLVEDILCAFYLIDGNGQPEKEPLGVIDSEMPVFHHLRVASPFPTSVFFQILKMMDPKAFCNVPLDGSKTRLGFTVTFPPADLWVISEGCRRDVHRVIINGLVSYQSAVCPLETGQHYLYSTPCGEIIQHTAFTTEVMDVPVRFDHQSTDVGRGHVSATFLPTNEKPRAQQDKSSVRGKPRR